MPVTFSVRKYGITFPSYFNGCILILFQTNQGIKNLPAEKAAELAGSDPDYSIRDLYNAIEKGNYPSWTWYLQVMTPEQAEKYKWNPFDVTKVKLKIKGLQTSATGRSTVITKSFNMPNTAKKQCTVWRGS